MNFKQSSFKMSTILNVLWIFCEINKFRTVWFLFSFLRLLPPPQKKVSIIATSCKSRVEESEHHIINQSKAVASECR
ncbi:unnamed protein product [Phytomonas sp. Hart1]|nr:unnamed protein product [Phytomonas sp. Hart1]|eukprot:CCW68289.1 unnamed protein product [Phytomonas sp. isolate Hart1]